MALETTLPLETFPKAKVSCKDFVWHRQFVASMSAVDVSAREKPSRIENLYEYTPVLITAGDSALSSKEPAYPVAGSC